MRRVNLARVVAVAGVVVMTSGAARGDGPRPFGSAGQLAISWDQPLVGASLDAGGVYLAPLSLSPLSIENTQISGGGGSITFFSIAPAADYFVSDHFSVGAQVLFGTSSSSSLPSGVSASPSTTSYGIAPELGYAIPLGATWSFWPKVFLAVVGAGSNSGGYTSGTLGIYAPFLWTPVAHFYMGLGPNISTMLFENEWSGAAASPSVSVKDKPSTFGLMATFGGYFLGDDSSAAPAPAVPAPAAPTAATPDNDDARLIEQLQVLCADGNDAACRSMQFATKKRGCCTGHRGAQKCDEATHVVCMDGQLSATCSCAVVEIIPAPPAEPVAPPPPPPAATSPVVKPAPPPPPVSPTAGCKPPTWTDENGRIHMKPGCK